ncbi:MAG: MarR family transcriptional regulator [Tetrasphaera sp.]
MTEAEERRLPSSVLMHAAYRAAEDHVFAALAAAGFDDITRAQGRLLAGIDEAGTRLLVLAGRARIAKQTAVVLVDRLEANGYVERVRDPSDGRARLVRLTDRGMALLPHARAAEEAVEEAWTTHLGRRDAARLHELLMRLRALADPEAG